MLKSRNSSLKIRRTWQPFIGLALVCVGSTILAACSTAFSELPAQVGGMPAAVGGLPAGAPERPAAPPAYPAVHDMPPPRASAVLSEDEKKKVEAELTAMRTEQAKRAAARGVE
jgi:hypothetical protein